MRFGSRAWAVPGRGRRRSWALAGLLVTGSLLFALVPSSAVASRAVFADDFESGTLARWATTWNFTVQRELTHGGGWAGRATASGGGSFARAAWPAGEPRITARVWFFVQSRSTAVALLSVRDTGGRTLLAVMLNAKGRLVVRNVVTGATRASAVKPGDGAWHELALDVAVQGAASSVAVTLDGAEVSALSQTTDLGTVPVGGIVVAFDDVLVSAPDEGSDTAPPRGPNVVVIVTDDMRRDQVMGLGHM
jgi:hypothetical protein